MSVTVVIPCFNHGSLLPSALDSVLAQTYPDWEIVIVDDGSTDDSLHVARGYADQHSAAEITIVRTRNHGLSRARNTGISVARGQYFLPLDADDEIFPQMLEQTVPVLDANAGTVAVAVAMRVTGERDWISNPPYSREREAIINHLPYCGLIRTSVWTASGGYAEDMYGYEDWDFWISVSEAGEVVKLDEVLFRYRLTRTGLFARAVARDLELRARIVKHHPRTYGSAAMQAAERILAGGNPSPVELAAAHPIFAHAPGTRAAAGTKRG